MYQFEEVSNDEGVALAKELNAIYKRTSAKEQGGGIDDLFKLIGKKFLHPDSENTSIRRIEKKRRKVKKTRN